MAGPAGEKTERATPKRREQARKEGNVARSQELGSAFAMLASFMALAIWGPGIWKRLSQDMVLRLQQSSEQGRMDFDEAMVSELFSSAVLVFLTASAPIAVILVLVGVAASVVQVKPQITPGVIKPRFSKLNPINGFKQKFSTQSLFELVKNIVKLLAVGIPAGMLLWSNREEILSLGDADPVVAGRVTVDLIMQVGLRVAGIYIVIAIADLMFQRWKYEKNIRMTKDEVKQEMRQQELAPELKAQQRRRGREMARRRMLAEVPTADVIITNPTHYAVALRYTAEVGAPEVVAKGVDLLALKIREIAADAEVERVENRELARELYARVEVGQIIPADLFAAVAEILAYVYKVRETGKKMEHV